MQENQQNNPLRLCIFGAGSIGCYVGGRLAEAGVRVTFIGRQRIGRELAEHGLHITDLDGTDLRIAPAQFEFTTEADAAAACDMILVCVKSAATSEAGHTLARLCRPDALVVSLQNGLGNADLLRGELPGHAVLTGIVEFNVVNRGKGAFHQGSEGTLEVETHPALENWLPAFERAGLPLVQHADMLPVQWAKLLLNLNNPINALSNIPLKEELSQRAFRQCVALAQAEALKLLHIAGIKPSKLTPLPPHWIPRLLTVPDWLFRLLGNRMLAIDPLARSSMWEDLEAGRTTEIEWINGEVVKLAAQLRQSAPVNARLVALIRDAEAGGKRDWQGTELLAELQAAG